jgi:prevent-host-death family protein
MVFDYGSIMGMEQIAISKFKATCLGVLERVRRTRKPVLVTRFGKPVAEIVPHLQVAPTSDWMGSMKGTARITGDIVAPASDEADWEALKS